MSSRRRVVFLFLAVVLFGGCKSKEVRALEALCPTAVGRPWTCPTWDALWNGQDACAVARSKR